MISDNIKKKKKKCPFRKQNDYFRHYLIINRTDIFADKEARHRKRF